MNYIANSLKRVEFNVIRSASNNLSRAMLASSFESEIWMEMQKSKVISIVVSISSTTPLITLKTIDFKIRPLFFIFGIHFASINFNYAGFPL